LAIEIDPQPESSSRAYVLRHNLADDIDKVGGSRTRTSRPSYKYLYGKWTAPMAYEEDHDEGLMETVHLLKSPAKLLRSIAEADRVKLTEQEQKSTASVCFQKITSSVDDAGVPGLGVVRAGAGPGSPSAWTPSRRRGV
jgi:hypothetical protein